MRNPYGGKILKNHTISTPIWSGDVVIYPITIHCVFSLLYLCIFFAQLHISYIFRRYNSAFFSLLYLFFFFSYIRHFFIANICVLLFHSYKSAFFSLIYLCFSSPIRSYKIYTFRWILLCNRKDNLSHSDTRLIISKM